MRLFERTPYWQLIRPIYHKKKKKKNLIFEGHTNPPTPPFKCGAYQPIHDSTATPPKSTIGEISKIANDFRDSHRRLNAAINNAKKVKAMNEFDFIQWSIDNGYSNVEFNVQQVNTIAHFQNYINNDGRENNQFTDYELKLLSFSAYSKLKICPIGSSGFEDYNNIISKIKLMLK